MLFKDLPVGQWFKLQRGKSGYGEQQITYRKVYMHLTFCANAYNHTTSTLEYISPTEEIRIVPPPDMRDLWRGTTIKLLPSGIWIYVED